MATRKKESLDQITRGTYFPIVEAFGFPYKAETQEAENARENKFCNFSGVKCEKFKQYHFGYCSVKYAADDDKGVPQVYAVCDHRLDGNPLKFVIEDHFKGRVAKTVPEVVLTQPRTSFDYVVYDINNEKDLIAIETQSVDLRGGGVGPAWEAFAKGDVENWRAYFTAEAQKKIEKTMSLMA